MGNPMGQTRLQRTPEEQANFDKFQANFTKARSDRASAAQKVLADPYATDEAKAAAQKTVDNEMKDLKTDANDVALSADQQAAAKQKIDAANSKDALPTAPDMADELLMKGAAGDVIRLRRGSRRNSFLGGAGDVRAPLGNTTLLGRGY